MGVIVMVTGGMALFTDLLARKVRESEQATRVDVRGNRIVAPPLPRSACGLLHPRLMDDGIMAFARRNGGVSVEFRPMSPEEIERTVQFLLHQQAQFAADFEKQSAKTDQMTEAVLGLTGIVGRVTERVEQLAEAQQLTDQQLKETNSRVSDVGEYITTVESHLNVVIEMFERHRREDHGHRPS